MSDQVLFITNGGAFDAWHAWRVCGDVERQPVIVDVKHTRAEDRCPECFPWLMRAIQRGEA